MKRIFWLLLIISVANVILAQEWDSKSTEWYYPRPQTVTPAKTFGYPPSDAIVLFDGKDLSNWQTKAGEAAAWKIIDGELIIVPGSGHIYTKDYFGDCQIHIEFKIPVLEKNDIKHNSGNSGVHIQDKYEVQILDNDESMFVNGMIGSIYKQSAPLVNAYTKRGEWQVYDIYWTAPKFGTGGVLEAPAIITVIMNGIVIHNHYVLKGHTTWKGFPDYQPHGRLPLRLGEHGDIVKFRNIWIRNL